LRDLVTNSVIVMDIIGENMSAKNPIEVDIRPWSKGDLPLLERLRGDPAMNVYLGGPEAPDKIHERQERYYGSGQTGINPMFVIVVGDDKKPVRKRIHSPEPAKI
jgi:hypothetical protein